MTQIINYWILTNPRSGSYFLSSLLNNSGKFNPLFKEYLNKDNDEFINPNKEIPKNCKVHGYQFNTYFSSLDELENKIGKTKYILLERENIYDRVISDYFARYTDVWKCTKKDKKIQTKFQIVEVPYDLKKIMKIYKSYQIEPKWNIDKDHLKVSYEELFKNTELTLIKIFKYFEIKITNQEINKMICSKNTTIKLDREDKKQYIERFKEFINTHKE